jgi:hypothetical protein
VLKLHRLLMARTGDDRLLWPASDAKELLGVELDEELT